MTEVPLHKEIEQRFGVLPNFFRLASDTPEVTMNLWGFAKFAYLDSPLPSLFKERLFVYLSRFCELRYCIARHIGFLVGLGYPAGDRDCLPQTIEQVLPLLQRSLPRGNELEPAIALCAAYESTGFEFPSADTTEESAIFACATHVFLQTPDAPKAMVALRQMFGTARMESLNVFLTFVRMAHYWTQTHPELRFDNDINHLLATHEALANCLFNDPEVEDKALSQRVLSELAELRQLKEEHESIVQSYEAVSRESEARFRSVFSNNMVPMGIWTATGEITDANDALLDLIGYTRLELEAGSIHWVKLTPPEYRDLDQQAIAEVTADGACTPYEKEFIHKDGHRIPIAIGGGYFDDQNEAGVFFALDLTDRKRIEDEQKLAEATIRESEEQLRLFVTASSDTVYKMSADWSEMRRLEGKNFLASTENPSTTWLEQYIPTEDQPQVMDVIQAAIHTKSVFELEHRIIQLDGTIGWTFSRAIPLLNAQQEIVEWFGAASDVTQRKQTEAALRESEELKQRILESSKDCIKVLTLTSEIVYINTGGLRLLEIDNPTFVLNACWLDFWQGENYENAKTAIAAAKASNTSQFQAYLPTYKGTPKWWDVIISPVHNNAGQVTQLLVVSRDITKQKQAETERERLLAQEQAAREAAENANRIKDEFLAVVSHELRSPLNPILGWSKLLQQGKLNTVKTKAALEIIERNSQLQAQLINDLLDISRILRGKLNLNQLPVDLTKVIAAALETVHLTAEAKSLHIETNFPLNIGTIIGDAERLQQVVWNLLSNAVKFTPPGGRITITLTQSTTSAQIQVTDNGKGINPEFLPYVFEHFRQEDGATTRKFGGLGLGLAIAQQIVKLHDGTVTVDSPGEGQGATFTVQLPLVSVSSQTLSKAVESVSIDDNLSNIHILVVDDEPDSREFVAFVLEQAGASVTSVTSGTEALQAIEQSVPDLIISDIGMPEMDGYMLMRQIRALPQGRQIPAIALTAYVGELDQQQARASGFQRHLAKPVEPTEITAVIAHLCGQKGQIQRK